MRRLRSVRFAMPPVERDGFAQSLRAYGWAVGQDGEAIVAEGPEGTTVEVIGDPE